MPLPQYHLGPGGLLATVTHPWLHAPTLLGASFVIDLEPGSVMLGLREGPTHAVAHTFAGAAFAAVLLSAAVLALSRRGGRPAAPRPVLLAAFAGAWTHVAIDALHHPGMRPFAPFAYGNPLLGAVDEPHILYACTLALAAALTVLTVRYGLSRLPRKRG